MFLALILYFGISFAVQAVHVEGISMFATLDDQDYLIANKIDYRLHAPQRGDIIILRPPTNNSTDFIKRIIGLPGDTIKVDSTHVWVDGVLLKEPYISSPANPVGQTWKVPSNEYFVLGDNRPVSDDSRDWGFVPKDFIVGKAVVVYWPLKNWELVNTFTPVYAAIKVHS